MQRQAGSSNGIKLSHEMAAYGNSGCTLHGQVNPLGGAVLDAVGEHLMRPEMAGTFSGIDLSNIVWACGILGVSPCSGQLLPTLALHITKNASKLNQQVMVVHGPMMRQQQKVHETISTSLWFRVWGD